jgi:uncharacterized RDD family membrane protein YckC
MSADMIEEASWQGQLAVFCIDTLIAFLAVLGAFTAIFGQPPDILDTFDFTVIMALNALCFSLPSVITGATIGAWVCGYHLVKDGLHPPGWILILRGIYFFPLGVIVGGLHLPLKLLMDDGSAYDPIFGLRLMRRAPDAPVLAPASRSHNRRNTVGGPMIFGTRQTSIEIARQELERALGIKLVAKTSKFWGQYFDAKGYGGATLMLLPNTRGNIGSRSESKLPKSDTSMPADYRAIFHVEAQGSKAALICDLIEATAFVRLR